LIYYYKTNYKEKKREGEEENRLPISTIPHKRVEKKGKGKKGRGKNNLHHSFPSPLLSRGKFPLPWKGGKKKGGRKKKKRGRGKILVSPHS